MNFGIWEGANTYMQQMQENAKILISTAASTANQAIVSRKNQEDKNSSESDEASKTNKSAFQEEIDKRKKNYEQKYLQETKKIKKRKSARNEQQQSQNDDKIFEFADEEDDIPKKSKLKQMGYQLMGDAPNDSGEGTDTASDSQEEHKRKKFVNKDIDQISNLKQSNNKQKLIEDKQMDLKMKDSSQVNISKQDFDLFQQNTQKLQIINESFNVKILKLKQFYEQECQQQLILEKNQFQEEYRNKMKSFQTEGVNIECFDIDKLKINNQLQDELKIVKNDLQISNEEIKNQQITISQLKKDLQKINEEKLMLSEKLEQVLNDNEQEVSQLQKKVDELVQQIQEAQKKHKVEIKNINSLNQDVLERVKEQSEKRELQQMSQVHKQYAQKIQLLKEQSDEQILKLQKDFLRDITNHAKETVRDIGCILNTPEELKKGWDEMIDQVQKNQQNHQSIFEIIYKILHPLFEDLLFNQEQLRQENQELRTHTVDLKCKIVQSQKEFDKKMQEVVQQSRLNPQQLQIFKQAWQSLCDRFDLQAMMKFNEQALIDSQQFIDNRLLKAMQGTQIDENFLELYRLQVQMLFTFYLQQKDQYHQISEKTKQFQQSEAKQLLLIQEVKDLKIKFEENDQVLKDQQKKEEEMRQATDVSITEKIEFKIQLDEKKEKLQILTEENKSLRIKLQVIDEENKNFKKKIKKMQDDLENFENVKNELQLLKNEILFVKSQQKLKEQDYEESRKSINNLQRALSSNFEEMNILKKQKEQESQLQKSQIEEQQEKQKNLEHQLIQFEDIKNIQIENEKQLAEQIQQIQQLRIEKENYKNQADQMIDLLKQEQEKKDFLVDRRMISQFLIKFIEKSYDRQTQIDMAQAMSKILQFSEEEKKSLGLETVAPQKRGFRQSLISFMMNDSDE